MNTIKNLGGMIDPSHQIKDAEQRYVGYFHELDAWTEYWDIYHPETQGRYYFGDNSTEKGLLSKFLLQIQRPPTFVSWTRMALLADNATTFKNEVCDPLVASDVREIDAFVGRTFSRFFGNPEDKNVQSDYLDAMFRFAIDTLPPASERDARISNDDPRKSTAGRHTLAGDLMWFAWSLQLEAAYSVMGPDENHARRALQLAGVAVGCAANFAWGGHRYTRHAYKPDFATAHLLYDRGMSWALDFDATRQEIHALYRIREWGDETV